MHQPESFKNQSSSVQSLSHVRLFVTPWITACQASLSITNSWSLLKLKPIESVMPSSHLILCHPLLLLPPVRPSIRVFSNESTLHMRWPSTGVPASVSVLPMNTQDWSPLGCTAWISLQSKGLSPWKIHLTKWLWSHLALLFPIWFYSWDCLIPSRKGGCLVLPLPY